MYTSNSVYMLNVLLLLCPIPQDQESPSPLEGADMSLFVATCLLCSKPYSKPELKAHFDEAPVLGLRQ